MIVFRNDKQYKKKNKGFSLIEVLLAIVLLGLIAAPVLQMFYSSYSVNQKSKKYLAAADLAQTVMEAISAQTYEGSEGSIKVSSTNESGDPVVVSQPVKVQGLSEYYKETISAGTTMPIYQVLTYYVGKDEDGNDVIVSHNTINGPSGSFRYDNSPSVPAGYKDYYFTNVDKYGGYPFNVRIRFNLNYEGESVSSHKYYVVGVTVDVCDYAPGVDFNAASIQNGSTPLIESVSTTVANTR